MFPHPCKQSTQFTHMQQQLAWGLSADKHYFAPANQLRAPSSGGAQAHYWKSIHTLVNRTWAMGAQPIGAPGWPDMDFCTISAASTRTVLIA